MLCLGGGPAADLLPEERGLGAEIQPPGHHHHHNHPPPAVKWRHTMDNHIIYHGHNTNSQMPKYIFFKYIIYQYSLSIRISFRLLCLVFVRTLVVDHERIESVY